nr:hypothetical protein [Tanacetum cinerariifolium]
EKTKTASSTTPPTPTPTTIVESAPRLSATAKGKQPSRAITPTEPTYVQRTEAKELKIVLKRSRQETQISQQRGSAFHFEERLRSLETSFFEYRQTNPFADAVSAIPDIVQ